MRRITLRSCLLGVVVAALILVSSTFAQDSEDQYPPHVIDVWPYPGEEVPADQAITITFDEAMDAASVEAAWQIEPAISGQFTWADDQTLNYLPDGGWQRATRYEISIGTEAKATNGQTLEETYDFFVQTIGYLNVAAVVPAPDAVGVAANATITVSFNRPVVPLVSTEQQADLPRPLTISPEVEGTGEWLNTSIYVFTPRNPLAGGQTYTVSIPAGLTDVTGSTLDETYSWQFKTLPPEILNVSPYDSQSNVLLDAMMSVQFSQPMDTASTEGAFSLIYNGEPVAGKFEWQNNGQTLTFKPDGYLHIDATYTLIVAPGAKSATGDASLEQGINYAFYTVPYPGISDTYPRNGETNISPGSGVTIYFKSPMNTETFEGKAEILEPAGVEWEPVVYGTDSFYMNFATQPDTTYTITFRKGAEDIYGNPIETDYTFTFRTGVIEPWASMPASGQFMITNAYRENTRMAMSVTAKPSVSFKLYQMPAESVGQTMQGYYYDGSNYLQTAVLVRDWTEELDGGPTQYGIDEVLLASENGGQLPTGVYYLEARLPGNDYTQTMALGVVTANVTVKRAEKETLIWVTDLQSGAPIVGTTVTLFTKDGRAFISGTTDEQGIAKLPMDVQYNGDTFIYAVAQSATDYGVWLSWNEPTNPDVLTYLYTDRPIYRPGQTVYFRGVVRDRSDMSYAVPTAEMVHVQIDINWSGQYLFDQDVALTEFGTFSGELVLPEDAQIGQGTITVRYKNEYDGQVSFTVAEFRVPEYKLEVAADNEAIIQGEAIKAITTASYYFGGAVSGAPMQWNARGEVAYFTYSGPGRYDFEDETQDYFSYYDLGYGQANTDANGQVIVNLENTRAPSKRPMMISIEGTVTDESGQYISGRTAVMAHPANIYVGLKSNRYFGREKTPFEVDLIAVTPDSAAIAGKKIDISVIEIRWERIPIEGQFGQYTWERKEIPVETGTVTTEDDGTAHYTFTPPQAGIYRIRASAMDERERENGASFSFWVTGENSVWWGEPSDTIQPIADKDSYQPGDTAEILVPIPFTGTSYVLVSVERAGIQQYEVRQVEGSSLVYQLPITETHVPTVYVSFVLVKGTDEENLNPAYRTGMISLTVEPVNQRLQVVVTPSTTRAQPGETVTLDVQTTDAHGEPVSAEVGVTVTDQAILSLMPPNSGTLEESFYGYQYNYVYTEVALSSLLDVMTDEILRNRDKAQEEFAADGMVVNQAAMPMAATPTMAPGVAMADTGGGPSTTEVTVREDFQQTPLWAPSIVTDASGKATVTVDLPDNLTTWHVDARGLTTNTLVGDGEQDVMATLPLLTRPVAPRFMVVGDRVALASVINNNTDAPQTVQATLEASGVTLQSDATQTITIEAGSRARVEWWAVVEDVEYADLTFYAIGENGYSDATKPTLATGPDGTIPVYRYTAPDTVGTGGVLREEGARTEAISLPPHLDTRRGELVIHVDPSLAATTVDALDYLEKFPHECIEQTISRFLPNVMTFKALKDLGIEDADLEANLRGVLDQALKKLANEQNPDGGWGWFGFMESNPYITAYAALGLIEVRNAGFDFDQTMLDRAINFVRTHFIRPDIDTPTWELNRQAFYVYIFARGGYATQSDLDVLLDQRLEMDYWALSFLLMAYHELDPGNAAVAQLTSDLQTGAILSATGAHWEEKAMDWWNWSSDTRTTAIALAALTRVQPDYDLLPNVVRWLMVARKGDHWETTQENAWGVMALTDWMVSTGELHGNYEYAVALNHNELQTGQVTPDNVREGQVLRVEVKDLLLDEVNRLTLVRGEGDGVMYYTAHLNVRLPAAEVKPISRGLTVQREYYLADKPGVPIDHAQVGDVITVRVTMTLPQDIYYFVLEDPIPAGTEPLDTSLLTTSQLTETPTIDLAYDPYWWWGWWLFDHTEMRDEQVNLYADFLPDGTYVYTYQVRASIPGEFQTMPSHGYAFYFPEVFGRSAGSLFTVTPAAETEE